MTTGIVTAPENGFGAWEQAEQKAVARDTQRQHWVELAYHALGFELQRQIENGQLVGFAWMPVRIPDTARLPQQLVSVARQAIEIETQTRNALHAKQADAMAQIQRQGLGSAAAEVFFQTHIGPAWAAHNEQQPITIKALRALGEAVEQLTAARNVINAAPQKEQAIDWQAQRAKEQIARDVEQAQAVLVRWGVT